MSQANARVAMSFHVYRGQELLRTERLAQDIVKIGKLASSHLRIEDENVSRMHAVIEASGPDEVHVIDLGSAAGTIVRGKKIHKQRLESGDEIVLGGHRVIVELEAANRDRSIAAAPEPARSDLTASPFVLVPSIANPFAPPIENPHMRPVAGPFGAPPLASLASAAPDAPEAGADAIRYGIAASGPPLRAADVECTDRAVEVTLMWGDRSALHVAHLSPPRAFYVGERTREHAPDYVLGAEALGVECLPVVLELDGASAIVVPEGAEGAVAIGEQSSSWAELAAAGQLTPCAEVPGAMQYLVPQGARAEVRYRGFGWVIEPTRMGKKVGLEPLAPSWQQHAGTIVSLAIHASFLLMFYFLPPRPSALALDLLSDDPRLVEYLTQPPETLDDDTPAWLTAREDPSEGGTGQAHADESGQMGEETAQPTTNRYAIEGPEDNLDPHMAREHAREAAASAGAIGVLQALSGSWASPTSPYGQDAALGADPRSALGALIGDQIGTNFGFGGLGPHGTGRGGGGNGLGTIGAGPLGTLGHGAGRGGGNDYGDGVADIGRPRPAPVPRIRMIDGDVRGSLSREVIRRVVRQHINEVRFCYEQELAQRNDLAGRVAVRFIISGTGAVQASAISTSTLGNARVEGCIVQAVRRWSFPAPDGGGVVGVNYPFVLDAH